LLQHDSPFDWSEHCETAFNQVKAALTSPQILTTFDPSLPLYLETDASPYGLGAILSYKINGAHKPIAYFSRTLTKAEMNYAHIDREATAIYFHFFKL